MKKALETYFIYIYIEQIGLLGQNYGPDENLFKNLPGTQKV